MQQPPAWLRRHAIADLALWSVVACLWIAASLLRLPIGLGIGLVVVALVGYAAWTLRRRTERWRDFGLRSDNLRAAAPAILAFTALGAAAELAWALAAQRSLLQPDILLLAPLYPLWGVLQQLIMQGVIHRRLATLLGPRLRLLSILMTALAFALLHVASPKLMLLTFVAGLGWSWLYARWPNVWLLGLSHGVLAALAYPLVLAEQAL